MSLLLVGGVVGGALLAFLPADNRVGKLLANYLTQLIGQALPLLYSWVGANYAGHTKKLTMNALLLGSFALGNVLGPLSFRGADAPAYVPAKVTIVAVSAVAMVLCGVLMGYYAWENRRRDRRPERGERVQHVDFLDLTDRQNIEFRYRL